jgi:hypothetical protein
MKTTTATPLFLASLIAACQAGDPFMSRAAAQVRSDARAKKAPSEPFGYTAAWEQELDKIGQITPQEFAQRYPSGTAHLDAIRWDPTTAKFWDRLNLEPEEVPVPGPKGERRTRSLYDFRLNPEELALFKRNGFVVSERLGGANFGELFYRIYSRDLPIFISSDALLHAWHRSYDAMLQETEESYLMTSLADILSAMAEGVPESRRLCGQGPLADCLADADYFLAVAQSLLTGQPVKSALGQDERVDKTLQACAALRLESFTLFGRERQMDFSQFKPRGHYESSERLQKYFRAMMWCGRIDLRVAGTPEESSPRELGAAIVLHDLLQRSGRWQRWQQFDRILQTFVGQTDSMTFAQLGAILAKAGIQSPADVKGLATLTKLQSDILSGKAGLQQIRGDFYFSPLGPEKIQLPRSFTVLGQKFVLDSWVMAKTVYDDILWDGEKVKRRIPASLDVAFAAFGNDQVVPDLVARMTNVAGRPFRDGLNYQHNLAAVRNVIDAQSAAAWDANLYLNWLACLRELSRPTTDPRYPEAMRTRAWAMKTLNTQLASWTQLRHDTVLYAKQSYTGVPACYYPAGYVEPIPHFWARLEKMATRAAELIEQTPYSDYFADEQVEAGIIEHRLKDRFQSVPEGRQARAAERYAPGQGSPGVPGQVLPQLCPASGEAQRDRREGTGRAETKCGRNQVSRGDRATGAGQRLCRL